MAMTERDLILQKKAKEDEARRLARLQAQANQGPQAPARAAEPIARPEVIPADPSILRGARPRTFPESRPVDLPVTPPGLKNVDDIRPIKPNLAPDYNPAGNQTVEQWYGSLPPSEQFRQRTQPGVAQTVAPPTQADLLRRRATDPNSTFMDRVTAVAGLPFASRTDTAPPADNRLVGTRDRGGNLQVFTPDEASRVMQEDEFQAALAAEGATSPLRPGQTQAQGGVTDTAVGNVSKIYRNSDGSFSSTPVGPDSVLYNEGTVASQPNDARARANLLRRTPTLGQGSVNVGGMDYDTRYMNMDASGYKDFFERGGAVSSVPQGLRNRYNAQVATAQARRMAGAAEGGNILRDINRINQQANKTFEQVNKQTNNYRAAQAAADQVREQADQLIDYDRTQSYREGDLLRAGVENQRIEQGYADIMARTQAAYGKAAADQLASNAETAAAAMLPRNADSDDKDRLLAVNKLRYMSNLPGNYDQLSAQGKAEADQQAIAFGSILAELSDEAGFNYVSMNDLLSDGRLTQKDLSFWRSFIEDGPWDAVWGDAFGGYTEVTLPGTTNRITVQQLRSLPALSRRGRREVFSPIRR